jgi:hypothetical protein
VEEIGRYDQGASNAVRAYIDTRLGEHDFSVTSNRTFNVSIDNRVANYDFSSNQNFNISVEQKINSHVVDLRNLVQTIHGDVEVSIENLKMVNVVQEADIAKLAMNAEATRHDIARLDASVDVHSAAIDDIKLSIGSVKDLMVIKSDIDELKVKLSDAVTLAGELDQHELSQVTDIVLRMMTNETHAREILQSAKINIQDQSFSLVQVLNVLLTADQVASVSVQYHDTQVVAGCVYVLTDGTNVQFNCKRTALTNGDVLLEFITNDWKGLSAQFNTLFARRGTTPYKVCKKEVALDWFEPISSTNVIFSLFSRPPRDEISRAPQRRSAEA